MAGDPSVARTATGTWRYLRRRSAAAVLRALAVRHPELRRPCVWDDLVRIAERERIVVRILALPAGAQGRLVRFGHRVFLQLSSALARDARTVVGFHELAHFWRDDPGVACYYSDDSPYEGGTGEREEFADIFAWAVTSPARIYVKGLREEDF